ncbi:hypothetical protein JRO89_XS03G0080800 [Xanthoceras sorbifolium]|uniref:C2 domain-containing protein n=1 Tax=Xanthoceras sorbifolium TaxID=99658 RepID=A0ABQ8I9D4_9ROSI|nr:hypothetical protein JRO89_XS03G0080800 [Xanthoceras sorbifolium]
MSSTVLAPFQLLELNVISAQDLTPASRSMRAYAVAWVHPDRKLSTRVDAHGRNNPTWNDKFVFRVDEEFLYNDTSAVMVEIYALHWFRDIHVGTVRVLVGNLINPPPMRSYHQPNHVQLGMRFVALQVRRPSGRPQGILNIGVALLDSSMRSMPLCTQLSSAVGYRHLMGEEDVFHSNNHTSNVSNNQHSLTFFSKPELRRSKSDTSSMVGTEMVRNKSQVKPKKACSMISGSEPEQPEQQPQHHFRIVNKYLPSSRASSIYSGSDFIRKDKAANNIEIVKDPKPNKGIIVKSGAPTQEGALTSPIQFKSDQAKKQNGVGYTSPYKPRGYDNGAQVKFKKYRGPLLTESELGPSPSEVAAVKAKEMLMRRANDEESSVMMSGWDMDSSVEGLQSKLERWRAELPPVYDSSFPSSSHGGGGGGATAGRHSRRHTDGGGGPGLFSCFSNICGCECSIVCGGGSSGSPNRKSKKKGGSGGRLIRSPSISSSFL